MYYYSKRSKEKLSLCHIYLQKIFNEVIKYTDCTILTGYRNEEDQTRAYEKGNSNAKWPMSLHNRIPSIAVDVMPYFSEKPHIRWDDKTSIYIFSGYVLGKASEMGFRIKWGGHFKSFFDGPHYQLILE